MATLSHRLLRLSLPGSPHTAPSPVAAPPLTNSFPPVGVVTEQEVLSVVGEFARRDRWVGGILTFPNVVRKASIAHFHCIMEDRELVDGLALIQQVINSPGGPARMEKVKTRSVIAESATACRRP
ncbi:hypothetical protein CONLIGDRAFT_685931 [Coniochaeta ligniaria NRRL 30616]|uniref:Uncharacterized protein n=1 Tax=Coniochaeta ligniaria NRRL 30616 TaxID=1408157 RepID=A0A1J7IT88_9PEZI|nr:hypothetical protein CONLIGDRAFT_685931 [Coniochaeta ligniaria NRRL 30616]